MQRSLSSPLQAAEVQHAGMSTDSTDQQEAAPPTAASDDRTPKAEAEAAPPASPEQLYQQVMARFAAITEEWQQARDAFLRR